MLDVYKQLSFEYILLYFLNVSFLTALCKLCIVIAYLYFIAFLSCIILFS